MTEEFIPVCYLAVAVAVPGAAAPPAACEPSPAGQGRAAGREQAPAPRDKPPPRCEAYVGAVTGVTDKIVVINGVDPWANLKYRPDGTYERPAGGGEVPTPRLFVFDPRLLPRFAPATNEHFAGDVRIGDRVFSRVFQTAPGVELCQEITIYRRPGGLVPPTGRDKRLPADLFASRWDVRYNAEQFIEEKVFPLFHQTGIWYLR